MAKFWTEVLNKIVERQGSKTLLVFAIGHLLEKEGFKIRIRENKFLVE